jgi:hypothetical protein
MGRGQLKASLDTSDLPRETLTAEFARSLPAHATQFWSRRLWCPNGSPVLPSSIRCT